MGRALALREDYDAMGLRALARTTRRAGQARRLLALASIYDGAARGDAARLAGMDRQIVRDWVMRFNAEGPDVVRDHHGGGVVPRLTSEMLSALKTRLEDGPIPAVHGVVPLRLCNLCTRLHETWGVTLSETRLGQIIRREGFRLLTARPQHYRQDTEAQDIFKKSSPVSWRRSGSDIPEKISKSGGLTRRGSARKQS